MPIYHVSKTTTETEVFEIDASTPKEALQKLEDLDTTDYLTKVPEKEVFSTEYGVDPKPVREGWKSF